MNINCLPSNADVRGPTSRGVTRLQVAKVGGILFNPRATHTGSEWNGDLDLKLTNNWKLWFCMLFRHQPRTHCDRTIAVQQRLSKVEFAKLELMTESKSAQCVCFIWAQHSDGLVLKIKNSEYDSSASLYVFLDVLPRRPGELSAQRGLSRQRRSPQETDESGSFLCGHTTSGLWFWSTPLSIRVLQLRLWQQNRTGDS